MSPCRWHVHPDEEVQVDDHAASDHRLGAQKVENISSVKSADFMI